VPNYKGHIVGGTIAFGLSHRIATINSLLTPSIGYEWVMLYLVCLAGSLFPDIDIQSKGQKLFYQALFIIILLIIAYHRMELLLPVAVVSFVPLLLNHRGITHNPWFVLFLGLCMPIASHWYHPELLQLAVKAAFFFIVGGWSHLVLDWGVVGFSKRFFRT